MTENENQTPVTEKLPPIHLMAYGFDYETNEIVARIQVDEGDFRELRLCEKDTKRMAEWFDLAKIMKKNKGK